MTNHPPENTAPDQRLITALLDVMAALRTPGTGCPWDLEQTFATIAPYTIEEAYEVADAIDKNDLPALKEELGDLLLQVVYHARMAEERQAFAFADVVEAITTKMIRRHPHVFGTAAERAAGAAPGFWDRIKAAEKGPQAKPAPLPWLGRGRGWGDLASSTMCPSAFPPSRAPSSCSTKRPRSASTGPRSHPCSPRPRRRSRSWRKRSLTVASPDGAASEAVTEEFGDLLFVMANVARHLKIDPETALRAANAKFVRRFQRIEALLAADGRTPSQSTLAEMDRLWDQAKAEERN